MSDANTREADLLIIRRGGSTELETPKGGVWKIAYADFMTAMMAFFLVMWLINATSETTKTGVANYFNPIKLADGTQLPRKGLQDPEEDQIPDGEQAEPDAEEVGSEPADAHAAAAEEAEHASSQKKARFTEDALFRDPYAVLAAIAAEADGTSSLVASGAGGGGDGAGAEDRTERESYGDPFDPAAWQASMQPAPAPAQPKAASEASKAVTLEESVRFTPQESEQEQGAEIAAAEIAAAENTAAENTAAGSAAAENTAAGSAAAESAAAENTARPAEPIEAATAGEMASEAHEPADATGADADASPLREQLAEALQSGSQHMPNVTVENADGGVLISLADQVEFGMFAIGSAEPLPETIAVMEKIAALVNRHPGKVIIRGHTDGRPFRSGDYDNWRLSSARAHMAYHMLVRGGLDEARVERIEGYADRDLKLPNDPDAAENRRIDILVQEVAS